MYPQGELKDLAERKRRVRQKIADERAVCAQAVADLAQPLEWIERMRERWQRLTPVVGLAATVFSFVRRRRRAREETPSS